MGLVLVVNLAKEQQVDFVIIAGDVFEHHDVDEVIVKRTVDILNRLDPITVYVLPGNHDPYIPGGIWERESWQRVGPHVILCADPEDLTYITLAQAGRIAGLSPNALKHQVWNGRLRAMILGHLLLTRLEWLQEYLDSRRLVVPSHMRRKRQSDLPASSSTAPEIREEGIVTHREPPGPTKKSFPEITQPTEITPAEIQDFSVSEPALDLDSGAAESAATQGYIVNGLEGIFATTHYTLRAMGVPEEAIMKRKYWHRLDRLPKAYSSVFRGWRPDAGLWRGTCGFLPPPEQGGSCLRRGILPGSEYSCPGEASVGRFLDWPSPLLRKKGAAKLS